MNLKELAGHRIGHPIPTLHPVVMGGRCRRLLDRGHGERAEGPGIQIPSQIQKRIVTRLVLQELEQPELRPLAVDDAHDLKGGTEGDEIPDTPQIEAVRQ